jgi:hypothetical protein
MCHRPPEQAVYVVWLPARRSVMDVEGERIADLQRQVETSAIV